MGLIPHPMGLIPTRQVCGLCRSTTTIPHKFFLIK
jgi:hypothetical protein